MKRNTDNGFVLNKMGLGPSLKTATKVQELTDNHRDYVTNHVRERE